jgi:peptide/nickel transport system substrate-binding protein
MDFKSKLEKINKSLDKITFDNTGRYFRRTLKRLPDISHLRNIVLFSALASLAIMIMFTQRFSSLYTYLPQYPVYGGTYTEGVTGSIDQLNPLFAPLNPAQATADSLIFNGLTKKDGNMQTKPDLAEKWTISPDGKTYTFDLRKNVLWHDGAKFSADDVIFTINTIQNPDVRSPYLTTWKGVTVEKKGPYKVSFTLPNAYAPFISLTDTPIVPAHILESVPPRNIKISEFSVKPVGTGPYAFEDLKKIRDSEEVILASNQNYFVKRPYISKFILKTYPTVKDMVDGYTKREVEGIEKVPADQILSQRRLPGIHLYQVALPEYDALYFNVRTGLQKNIAVRQAISMAIDRAQLSDKAYQGNAAAIYGPILPGFPGNNNKLRIKADLAAAKKKLADDGYVAGKDGILAKEGKMASVRLLTSDDAQKSAEADYIAGVLKTLGIQAKVEKYALNALVQDHIRARDFDLLLISQNLGSDPDLYSFWNSTQSTDPGLNFSGFSDRRLDKYLEQARSIIDPVSRADRLKLAQQIIWDNAAAIFLVRPEYDYGVSNKVKGIKLVKIAEPKDRFWNVQDWYSVSTTDPLKAGK